jgi:putative phosphoribosyl transferase
MRTRRSIRADRIAGRFRDRREAGELLASRLSAYHRKPRTIVLGLPRGGVVPAAVIARTLEVPLDVIISRKLHAPGNPELAIGAIAEGGEPYLNPESLAATEASESHVARELAEQRSEIARRQELFRGGAPLRLPERSTAILVDDGIATGSTVVAAIQALRRQTVERIVLAVPVAPPDTVEELRPTVEELVVLSTPILFWAVGQFYDDFRQVSDEEVRELLAQAASERTAADEQGARSPSPVSKTPA